MVGKNMLDFMSSFSDDCKKATSLEALNEVLKISFAGLSVKMFSYIHCPPIGSTDYRPAKVITYFGYPPEWVEYYTLNKCSDYDPFVAYAFEKNRAFEWTEAIDAYENDTSRAEFMSKVKSLNISKGYAFPVFGARYSSGFFTMGFDESASNLSEFQLSMLQWACQLAHYRFVELKAEREVDNVNLTDRETEIVKLVSLGKSNSEISDILHISKHTIDGYLRNVYLKLQVTERVSASHRAVALGLI